MRVKGCIWDHCSKHNYSTNESALLQYCWENVVIYYTVSIDGLQMSIKRSISGGQTHNQETTVQWTIHFKRNSFFYPSALMVRIRCSASMPDRTVPNADPDSLPAGIEAIYAPMPWKPSFCSCMLSLCFHGLSSDWYKVGLIITRYVKPPPGGYTFHFQHQSMVQWWLEYRWLVTGSQRKVSGLYRWQVRMKLGVVTEVATFFIITQISSG